MAGIETQIVQGLAGLMTVVISAGIALITTHVKTFVSNHSNSVVSQLSNDVIDGFGKIADAVVHDFNDRIVREAQANGVLTPQLFAQVKRDAVNSVMDQGASLVQLGTKLGLDVQGLAFSVVAQSFNKIGVAPSVPVQVTAPAVTQAAQTVTQSTPSPSTSPTSTVQTHVENAAAIGTVQA